MKTKIFWVVLTMLAVPHFVYGQHYYTEGTRWTELRLDTTKYPQIRNHPQKMI